ncbi:ATP-dependent dethiobiotin synthetase BioD [Corynebacterium pseudodiphtheriticum]|uniref:ATP-dependent dethiobiotin synthetase BioD n=1 Tax=Corynebacterium pseudodiphtheriticum TaxID=37637 RepID=UPI0006913DAA|nr:ATP-dependent dethiobiotin synthetase BioD [Corynebacterium pseudodiphtheriticum]
MIITGTGTGVGKTIAAATLGWAWQQPVLKPLQTGDDDDAAVVTKLTGIAGDVYRRYPDPLAPNLAAKRAGLTQADRDAVGQWISDFRAEHGICLVEGAGGLLVRLGTDRNGREFSVLDLAKDLGEKLVVVTSTGLGSLNMAELTVRTAEAAGVEVAGLIGGSMSEQPDLATELNVQELPRVTGKQLWFSLPEAMGECSPEEFRERVDKLGVPAFHTVAGLPMLGM